MSDLFGPPAPDLGAIAFWDAAPSGAKDIDGKPLLFGEGPLYSEDPWDVVMLGGEKLPGICDAKCRPQLQIDQQKGPKHDGARLSLHGTLPSPVEISCVIWTQEQWAKFVELIPLWWRQPLKDPAALKAIADREKVSTRDAQLMQAASFIYHPALTAYKITQVVVTGPGLPEPGPVAQSKIIRINCIEYKPPTTKTSPHKVKKPTEAPIAPEVSGDPPSKTHVAPNGLASQ